MSDMTDALTTKLGPLPAWGWGLAAGGLIVAFQAFSGRDDESAGDAAEGTTPEPSAPATVHSGDSTYELSAIPQGSFGLYRDATPGRPTEDTPDPSVTTNSGWRIAATRWAVSNGHSTTDAVSAFSKLFDGNELTSAELDLINNVSASIGPPPQGFPPVRLRPAPTGQPPPAKQPPPTPRPQPRPEGGGETPPPVQRRTPPPPATRQPPAPPASKWADEPIRPAAVALGGKAGPNGNRVYFTAEAGTPFYEYVNTAAGKRSTGWHLDQIAAQNGFDRRKDFRPGLAFSVPKSF